MSKPTRRKPLLSDPGPPLSPLPPPRRSLVGVWRAAIPVLLALYLCLAVVHARLAPTGQTGYQNAPDEAAHMVYVRTVAAGHLPARETAKSDPQGYEWHQPPLYYFLAARVLPLGERAVRGLSILCGLAGLWLIYRAARVLFPDDPFLAALAVGLAALTPTHIAITSTVNNDALLEVCFSGALLALFGALTGGFTLARAAWLGLALGAAILTKATGVLLIPVALLAFFLLWRGGETPQNVVRGAAWTGLIAVAICGWWLARNAMLYGEWLPLTAFRESFGGTAQAQDMAAQLGGWGAYWQLVGQWSFQSFWAVYGDSRAARVGAPRFLPEQLYLLTGLISVAALVGLVRAHFRRTTEFTETQRYGILLLFATAGLVALSFVGFLRTYFQTQGRYLFPAMLPLSLLFGLGWRSVLPERYGALASGLLLILLTALSLAFLRYVAFAA